MQDSLPACPGCDGGERKFPGGARDSRAVCGDSPQTPDARVFPSGVQI
jgi:hypothetical protein